MKIENGIVLVERYLNCNYVLTLGTDYKKFDPYNYLLENYIEIKKVMKDMKDIIYNDSIPYAHG